MQKGDSVKKLNNEAQDIGIISWQEDVESEFENPLELYAAAEEEQRSGTRYPTARVLCVIIDMRFGKRSKSQRRAKTNGRS